MWTGWPDNTNITNVVLPGGSYNKWVASGMDNNYLPHWLKAAGYQTECTCFLFCDTLLQS